MILISVGILVNSKQEVLLASRAAHKPDSHLLEFPGGKIEQGETPEETLAREMSEEIGILAKPDAFEKLGVYRHDYGYAHISAHAFVIREWANEATPQELQKIYWMNPLDVDPSRCLALLEPIWKDYVLRNVDNSIISHR